MGKNLSYNSSRHEACNGEGCEECDYEGRTYTRRTNAEIAQAHISAAESAYWNASGEGNSAYHRGVAESHMEIARTYLEMVKIEQLTRIADALEASHELATNPYL